MSELPTDKTASQDGVTRHTQQPRKEKRYQHQYGGNREERDYYQQQRPHYRKQNKPVYVEDLREKLNRKRREKEGQGTSLSGPPPDPNYNFLKDPARDGEPATAPHEKRHQYNQNRRPNDFKNRHHFSRPQESNTIQPVNIKVELSTSTGHRSCIVDEQHKLPEIKHVPDVHERGKKFQNTRFYNNSRNARPPHQQQQHQKRPPPPQRKFYQQNKGNFQGGSRKDEVPVLGEENWDAPANNTTDNKGEVDGGDNLKKETEDIAANDSVNSKSDIDTDGNLGERSLNTDLDEENWEDPEELYGNETEGKDDEIEKNKSTENNENNVEEKEESEVVTKQTENLAVGIKKVQRKESEEADLKETIIIEASKK